VHTVIPPFFASPILIHYAGRTRERNPFLPVGLVDWPRLSEEQEAVPRFQSRRNQPVSSDAGYRAKAYRTKVGTERGKGSVQRALTWGTETCYYVYDAPSDKLNSASCTSFCLSRTDHFPSFTTELPAVLFMQPMVMFPTQSCREVSIRILLRRERATVFLDHF
jgi:hypothetical protein